MAFRKNYRHRNASGTVIRLDIGDATYEIEPGGEIDIPDSMAMKRMGAAPGVKLDSIISMVAPQMVPCAGVKIPDGIYLPPAPERQARGVQRVSANEMAAEEAAKQALEVRKRVAKAAQE